MTAALEPCSSSTTDWIINMFEAEQKSAVFGSLAGYLNTATFADVSLACRNQVLRAHKVVLAASSKFFSDLFRHNPAIGVVDLDRELSPNGLDLTYEDVQLIIGILYCVGTVEISPERIESLLLIAQVLGIPTLIHLLKRIKRSLSATPDPSYSQSFTVKPASTFQTSFDRSGPEHMESHQKRSSSSVSFFSLASPRCTPGSFGNNRAIPSNNSNASSSNTTTNNNVLETLDPSFLQQLNNLHQIDDIENALLPHLQNNASSQSFVDGIGAYEDDSEAPPPPSPMKSPRDPFDASPRGGLCKLLPSHQGPLLTDGQNDCSSSSIGEGLLPPPPELEDLSEPLRPLDRSEHSSKVLSRTEEQEGFKNEKNETVQSEERSVNAFKEKSKVGGEEEADGRGTSSPCPPVAKHADSNACEERETSKSNAPLCVSPSSDDDLPPPSVEGGAPPETGGDKEIIEETESDEIRVNLDSIASNGKSIRLSIPGASNGSVTLNFTAEALTEMRNSFMMNKSSEEKMEEEEDDQVSSSTQQPEPSVSPVTEGMSTNRRVLSTTEVSTLKRRRKKEKRGSSKSEDKKSKSVYKCSLCSQSFSSQKAFEKHGSFHMEQSSCTCIQCGKTFRKRWALEQHMAIDHGSSEGDCTTSCEDCGKTFGWKRNLLAHVLLHHQKEIRYRCRYCPLTFLKKKLYLNHHRNKHKDKPPTWCTLCLKVFENSKVLEDHLCEGLENTGERVICHKEHPEHKKNSFSFTNLKEVEAHIREFHPNEKVDCQMKSSCPVCHKKFLLKRYLFIHVRRFHDEESSRLPEEARTKLSCRVCKKVFLYEIDRKNHESVHEASKKFNCTECDKSYYWKKALLSHVKTSHRGGESKPEYKCEVCDKKLSNKYKLRYHMTVHSDVKFFMCNICGIKFKAQDNLLRHKKKYHKIPPPPPPPPQVKPSQSLEPSFSSLKEAPSPNEKTQSKEDWEQSSEMVKGGLAHLATHFMYI